MDGRLILRVLSRVEAFRSELRTRLELWHQFDSMDAQDADKQGKTEGSNSSSSASFILM